MAVDPEIGTLPCTREELFHRGAVDANGKFSWNSTADSCDRFIVPLLNKLVVGNCRQNVRQSTSMIRNKERAYNSFFCPHDLSISVSWAVVGDNPDRPMLVRTKCVLCSALSQNNTTPKAATPKNISTAKVLLKRKVSKKMSCPESLSSAGSSSSATSHSLVEPSSSDTGVDKLWKLAQSLSTATTEVIFVKAAMIQDLASTEKVQKLAALRDEIIEEITARFDQELEKIAVPISVSQPNPDEFLEQSKANTTVESGLLVIQQQNLPRLVISGNSAIISVNPEVLSGMVPNYDSTLRGMENGAIQINLNPSLQIPTSEIQSQVSALPSVKLLKACHDRFEKEDKSLTLPKPKRRKSIMAVASSILSTSRPRRLSAFYGPKYKAGGVPRIFREEEPDESSSQQSTTSTFVHAEGFHGESDPLALLVLAEEAAILAAEDVEAQGV